MSGIAARAQTIVACVILLATVRGCSGAASGQSPRVDFTLEFDSSVSDAELATITALQISASGDEVFSTSLTLGRAAMRIERFVYRPLPPTQTLDITIAALNETSVVATGSADLTLSAGHTSAVTIHLGMAVTDLGIDGSSPVDASVAHDSASTDAAGDLSQSTDLATPAYAQTVLADSPLAYYRFEETSGTVAKDSSGHGLDGTYGASITHPTGLTAGSSHAAAFPGGAWSAASIVQVPRTAMLEPPTKVTVEAWVRTTVVDTGNPGLVSYGPDSWAPYEPYILQLDDNKAGFYTATAVAGSIVAPSMIPLSMSHHLVGTFDGVNLFIYVDGLAVANRNHAGTIENYDGVLGLAIGSTASSQSGTRTVFNGTIDEVAIYGTALSPARIQAHHTAGIP